MSSANHLQLTAKSGIAGPSTSSLEQSRRTYRGSDATGRVPATMGAAGPQTPDAEHSARAMGATVRALRGHAHISQFALGRRVSMHANYLGAIERGEIRNPGLETVDRVAAGLGVSVAVLARSYADASGVALRVDATGGRPQQLAARYDAKALGAAIRAVRRAAGLTQAQLGDLAGLHRNHVGSIEAGEQPTRGIATIARIAHGLTRALDADESLLPLIVQTFTGEATLAQVRELVASKPSGPRGARNLPPGGR